MLNFQLNVPIFNVRKAAIFNQHSFQDFDVGPNFSTRHQGHSWELSYIFLLKTSDPT